MRKWSIGIPILDADLYCGVAVGLVLRRLLQFTAWVHLDERLADCVDSPDEWLHLRAIAGCILCALSWWFLPETFTSAKEVTCYPPFVCLSVF